MLLRVKSPTSKQADLPAHFRFEEMRAEPGFNELMAFSAIPEESVDLVDVNRQDHPEVGVNCNSVLQSYNISGPKANCSVQEKPRRNRRHVDP